MRLACFPSTDMISSSTHAWFTSGGLTGVLEYSKVKELLRGTTVFL